MLNIFRCLGNPKIADLLIKSNANVNATDKDGWTPLFFAAVNGNAMLYRLYLQFLSFRIDNNIELF